MLNNRDEFIYFGILLHDALGLEITDVKAKVQKLLALHEQVSTYLPVEDPATKSTPITARVKELARREYQNCPRCGGSGMEPYMGTAEGTLSAFTTTCAVCRGARIIERPA